MKRTGFTLIELMISIGILAIGGAMVATAFVVSMAENKESVKYTMGALVSENALAICRQKLRHSDLNGTVAVAEGKYTDVTEYITPAEAAYPMARLESETPAADWPRVKAEDWIEIDSIDYPSARYGWFVGARQPQAGVNDYELSIVVYEKFLPKDRPGHEIQFAPSCKAVKYVPAEPEENPNPRDPTILCWITRTALRP